MKEVSVFSWPVSFTLAPGLWFQWSILHNRPAESTGTHTCFVTVIPSLWKWGPVVVDSRCVVQSGSREVFAWSPEKREWQWTYKHSEHRRYSQRQWAGWVESLNIFSMQFGIVWIGGWSMLTVLFEFYLCTNIAFIIILIFDIFTVIINMFQ